ncbi:hypothetical protein AABB02_38190 [Streptomyces rimosus]|uniref:hypothetical protein n=1 Tax=Streptomyces rimosus TaxID=1927 RepID=UPI0031E0A244
MPGATDPVGTAGTADTARNGTAGTRGTTGSDAADTGVHGSARDGCSNPVTGRAVSVSAPAIRLSGAEPRTPRRDGAPMNEGFCHVGSRSPNPASATSARPSPTDR